MLKLKLLASCLLACSLCCWTVGCGGETIDTAPPVDLPDDGDPATESADPDTGDGADAPEGTE